MTNTDAIKAFLNSRKYSKKTVEAYAIWVTELERYYPNENINDLQENQVLEFLEHIRDKRKLSHSTLRQAKIALELYYRNIVKRNVSLKGVVTGFSKRPIPSIPTQSEVLSILGAIADPQYKIAIFCIYGMGLALSEAIDIKVSHVDLGKGVIKIVSQGKKKDRLVIIPEKVKSEIHALLQNRRKADYLFQSSRGGRLDEKALQRAFTKSKNSLGIKGEVSLRTLRHAYIKHMEFLGVPLVHVVNSMGLSTYVGGILEFYSSIGYPETDINFSPADRIINEKEESSVSGKESYVSEKRITELSQINSDKYDLSKLIEILREINIANRFACFMSIGMLVRSVIDHIPPIFGCKEFSEVANNYPGATKSFKKSMAHLEKSLRNVADSYLHTQIRKRESSVDFVQIDFRADIDVLLSEVVRVLQ